MKSHHVPSLMPSEVLSGRFLHIHTSSSGIVDAIQSEEPETLFPKVLKTLTR